LKATITRVPPGPDIVNLTTQFPDQIPSAQPPRPRAVADGVDRQFVDGKNHIGGPALR